MLTAAVVMASLALVIALLALAKASHAIDQAADANTSGRRHASNIEESLRGEVTVLRGLLARLVGGEELTSEMVRDGILWRDVDPAEARRLIDAGGVAILDVRTPQETATGVIPGAQILPSDEIEERRGEVPTDKPLLVYCAGGGRSAAVCEFLATQGHARLMNLTGGFGSWDGAVERAEN